MAEYRWKFDLKKKYILKVNWRIGGMATVFLNRKMIFEGDSRTFSHSFVLDGVICNIRFEMENVSMVGRPHTNLDLWTPHFYLDEKKIKPS